MLRAMADQDPIKLSREELEQITESIRGCNLSKEQKELVIAMLRTLDEVCLTLEQKKATIARLRKLLGIKSEKIPRTQNVSSREDSEKKTRIGLMGMTSLGINPLLLKFPRL
jgi:hypothetical protein